MGKRQRSEITPANPTPRPPPVSTLRDTTHLYALKATVDCCRTGCIACAYKLLVTPPTFSKENPVLRLHPKCARNVRPEDCPRYQSNKEQPGEARGLYRQEHTTLIVGDGNFSFSLSLARSFQTKDAPKRLVCTSYQDHATLLKVYPDAEANLAELKKLGCLVLHNVDAMDLFPTLKTSAKESLAPEDLAAFKFEFDRIIFNFPCVSQADGYDAQTDDFEVNQILVRKFLVACISTADADLKLNAATGEVHIAHKTKAPFGWWNISKQGPEDGNLTYTGDVVFDRSCFPSYVSKKVEDKKSFPIFDAVTHVFAVSKDAPNSTLPFPQAADAQASDSPAYVDWDDLPTSNTLSQEQTIVKLSNDALWLVVSFLQFAVKMAQMQAAALGPKKRKNGANSNNPRLERKVGMASSGKRTLPTSGKKGAGRRKKR